MEAERSSTMELDAVFGGWISLHCRGEARSQPIWYHDGAPLSGNEPRTDITISVNSAENLTVSDRHGLGPSMDWLGSGQIFFGNFRGWVGFDSMTL